MAYSKNVLQILMIVSCTIITLTECAKIEMLGKTYWTGLLIQDGGNRMPDGLSYGADETLIFFGNQTRSYTNTDFTRYKNLLDYERKIIPNSLKDSRGNILYHSRGKLYLSEKATKALHAISTEDKDFFYKTVMNETENLAFMVGVKRRNALGSIYVLNTNSPKKSKKKVIIDKVTQLGSNNKAISLLKDSGDIAILKKAFTGGWKVILLSAEKSKILIEDYDEGESSSLGHRDTTATGDEKKFIDKIKKITDDVLKMCNVESKPVKQLKKENQLLKIELKNLKSRRDYILKKSGVDFKIADKKTDFNYAIEQRDSFINVVKRSQGTIIRSINTKSVMWLDKSKCDSMFPIVKKTRDCGKLKTDPMISQELPWAIQILRKPDKNNDPYIRLCYGALIHPNIVLAESDICTISDNLLPDKKYISRSGRLTQSLQRSSQDNDIVIEKKLANLQEGDDQILLLVLQFPYKSDRVICFPSQQIFLNTGKCYAVYESYTQTSGEKLRVEKIDTSSLIKCHKDFFDPSDGYFCRRNLVDCSDNYHVVFCPEIENPEIYTLTSLHYYTNQCEAVQLDVFRSRSLIEKVLKLAGYDMSSYYA